MRDADKDLFKMFGVFGLVAAALIMVAVAMVREDQHERALVASGACEKIMEALYQPPPSYTTTCTGGDKNGMGQYCHTYVTNYDPYMRTLWRCKERADGDTTKVVVSEFWRRSAEEDAR